MNVKLQLLTLACACPLCAYASGVDEVLTALRGVECYQATADYQVLMSLQNDVNYTISLQSQVAPADTLAPCSYILSWHTDNSTDSVAGFCAYSNGNMFVFRGDRMQEYHYAQNPAIFLKSGTAAAPLPGIQMRGQFSNLLPQFIANDIENAVNDHRYTWEFTPDTVVSGQNCSVFKAEMTVNGNIRREITYAFNRESHMPLFSETENNPGALAEQTILCKYIYPQKQPVCRPITEQMLGRIFPHIFELYRESTFTITNLPSQPLPTFTLPTTTGERHEHIRGQGFAHPTVLVILDALSEFATPTINETRRAIASLPQNADIIWAFTNNNTDDIETVIRRPRVGEHLLQSAKALARDCGATALPAVIFCDTDGIVQNVMVGFNNNFAADVIQKAVKLK